MGGREEREKFSTRFLRENDGEKNERSLKSFKNSADTTEANGIFKILPGGLVFIFLFIALFIVSISLLVPECLFYLCDSTLSRVPNVQPAGRLRPPQGSYLGREQLALSS